MRVGHGRKWLQRPVPAFPTEALIAQGLACLPRIDAAMWGRTMERRLRNPEEHLWLHVPKDGVEASTLDVVARIWFAWVMPPFIPGILLVYLPTDGPILTGLGFALLGIACTAYFIGVDRLFRGSRARRAWRRCRA
jgi:hypothetical protein